MSQFVVGLTGGIGSGKTTVSDLFAAQGAVIVDADIIARDVVNKGTAALNSIRQRFGSGILHANGELNRGVLREKVFSQPEDKQWLNQLLHPLIREEMIKQTQAAQSEYCILSVPLLLENKLTHLVNRVLVVDLKEETQLLRATVRDQNTPQQIRAIMDSQLSREHRCQAADDIINNDGGPDQLSEQVTQLHQDYLALSH